jgi:glycosyltransferase involved in cell wall biosynthesis
LEKHGDMLKVVTLAMSALEATIFWHGHEATSTGSGRIPVNAHPLVAVVIATVGRPKLLERLLASLAEQTLAPHEVIVVDQSGDDDTQGIVERWRESLPVQHLTSGRGASVGRNTGIAALGDHDMVVFPDDDSWYASDAFARGAAGLRAGAGVVSGRMMNPSGGPAQLRFGAEACPLDDRTVWTKAIAETCFFSADFLRDVGGFDEGLGIGCRTPWQSGAETDLLLRGLRAGWPLVFDPRIVVYEDNADDPRLDEPAFRAKARHAARGTGRVYRCHYGRVRCAQAVIRPLGAGLMYAFEGRWAQAGCYLQRAVGRLEGLTGFLLPAPDPVGAQRPKNP